MPQRAHIPKATVQRRLQENNRNATRAHIPKATVQRRL